VRLRTCSSSFPTVSATCTKSSAIAKKRRRANPSSGSRRLLSRLEGERVRARRARQRTGCATLLLPSPRRSLASLERDSQQTAIKAFGSAAFWTTTQLLTVSSQITVGGRILDVFMEIYAITVIASLASAIAGFLQERGQATDDKG
jgi:hypothetical protein